MTPIMPFTAPAAIPSPASTPRPWRCSPAMPARSQALAGSLARRSGGRRRRRLLQGGDAGRGFAPARPHRRGHRDAGERGDPRERRSWRPLEHLAPARHGRRLSRHGRGRARGPARAARAAPRRPLLPAICSAPTRRRKRRSAPPWTPCSTRSASASLMARSPAAPTSSPPRPLLDRGVELHVVLPFEEEDFLLQSVLPGGAGWEARYRACRDRAASVAYASPMAYFGNPAQYGYASRIAMGLARLRAEHLAAEAVQLAIWDGVASDGPAGTGADVAAWAAAGERTRIVDPGAGRARPGAARRRASPRPMSARSRRSCSPISRASRP